MSKTFEKKSRGVSRLWVVLAALVLGLVGAQWVAMAVEHSIKATPENQYVGAGKCKSCHNMADSGDQYGKWAQASHAKAFTLLTTDKAKEVAKAQGIDDPSTSDKCLSCHVTGYGEPANHFASSFDPKQGVGCESCHGAGQKHAKARLAATSEGGGDDFGFDEPATSARVELPAGEILAKTDEKHCLECHNDKSPTFKPFDFKERHAKIAHVDPRKAK